MSLTNLVCALSVTRFNRERARNPIGEQRAKVVSLSSMDEARKRMIFLAAAMFLCRRLASLDGRPSPARELAYRDSIDHAVELMRRIDARYPSSAKSR